MHHKHLDKQEGESFGMLYVHKKYWDGKDHEEGVVFFKEAGFYVVVVFVEVPEEAVHYVFVGGPGNEFHYAECAEQD